MHNVSKYGKILNSAQSDFIECKAYMHVGGSMHRLSRENMPNMNDIRDFAERLANESEYVVSNEDSVSRVVLLAKS